MGGEGRGRGQVGGSRGAVDGRGANAARYIYSIPNHALMVPCCSGQYAKMENGWELQAVKKGK